MFSGDEDDDEVPPRRRNTNNDEMKRERRRKKLHLLDEEEPEEEKQMHSSHSKMNMPDEAEEDVGGENDEPEAQPLGDVIKTSGKGRGKRTHYTAFDYDGQQFQLEDSVLLVPETLHQKPYVAIIKDISQRVDGAVMVTGQWFYRPEEAEKRGGGNWQSSDTRELFYSFHRDEVPAESVMHKCIVHFVPLHKQIPTRKKHPGFIVQKVYDTEQRRLFKLTDKDYEDNKQQEIDLLVTKTLTRVGGLPDIEADDAALDREDPVKIKRLQKKRLAPLDLTKEDEGLARSMSLKADTPGSAGISSPEHYFILSNFNKLTGETQRDKWLEKLLQSIQSSCFPAFNKENATLQHGTESEDKDNVCSGWPDSAVNVVAALEGVAHDTLSSDFLKYNQKMRSLTFNIKNTSVLAIRLLKGELEPAQIINMSPEELKAGLTSEEIGRREPEESDRMQMTDARCKRCNQKQVGLKDIIQAGHGDRYQLECVACGNTWFVSRDDAPTFNLEAPTSAKKTKSMLTPSVATTAAASDVSPSEAV